MDPVTKKVLQEDVDRINRLFQFEGGDQVVIEYTMGKPRLYRSFGAVEVGPRLTKTEMALFLWGLYEAHSLVIHQTIVQTFRALEGRCRCGHFLHAHQSGEGPWTGFCADPECKCESPEMA